MHAKILAPPAQCWCGMGQGVSLVEESTLTFRCRTHRNRPAQPSRNAYAATSEDRKLMRPDSAVIKCCGESHLLVDLQQIVLPA